VFSIKNGSYSDKNGSYSDVVTTKHGSNIRTASRQAYPAHRGRATPRID
jgi:hypothetical protein